MKVLLVNSVVASGSTGRIVENIRVSALGNNIDAAIVYGRGRSKDVDHHFKISNNTELILNILITRLFDRHCFATEKSTTKLINIIEKYDPQIIHLHNIHGYYLNNYKLFKYLKTSGRKVVWTLHDCWPITGHCAHFEHIKCDKWRDGCEKCPLKSSYPKSVLFDRSSKNYFEKKEMFNGLDNLTIVTPSSWLANIVAKSYLKNYPIKIIYNGVDNEIFKPGGHKSSFLIKNKLTDKFIILGVSPKLSRSKGLGYFLKISEKLKPDEQIVLVGRKPGIQLPSNILVTGVVSDVHELAKIYNAADVFVNPTIADTFPTTNLESLSCGVPIVTFDTGGCKEAINKNTGIVVKQGDSMGLLDAIAIIKKKGKIYYSCKCRARGVNYFNQSDRLNDYIKLYQEILS